MDQQFGHGPFQPFEQEYQDLLEVIASDYGLATTMRTLFTEEPEPSTPDKASLNQFYQDFEGIETQKIGDCLTLGSEIDVQTPADALECPPKRRRGRPSLKPKVRLSRKRETERLAARKYRLNKKAESMSLELEEQRLAQKNCSLKAMATKLEDLVMSYVLTLLNSDIYNKMTPKQKSRFTRIKNKYLAK